MGLNTCSQVLSLNYDMNVYHGNIFWNQGKGHVVRVGSSKKLDPTFNTHPNICSTYYHWDWNPSLLYDNIIVYHRTLLDFPTNFRHFYHCGWHRHYFIRIDTRLRLHARMVPSLLALSNFSISYKKNLLVLFKQYNKDWWKW